METPFIPRAMQTMQEELVIECLHSRTFRDDKALREELRMIVCHSYKDVSPLLDGDVERCTNLYLGRMNNSIVCFFLVSHESLVVNGRRLPVTFLGFSGTSAESQSTGTIWKIYERAISDVKELERGNGDHIIWYTTATPSAYFAMERIYGHIYPDREGGLSTGAEAIVEALRLQWYPNAPATRPCCILRGVAAVRYSEQEQYRIQQLTARKKFRLFEQYELDESNGDRVLVLAQTAGL